MQNGKNPRSQATEEKIYNALLKLLKTKKFKDIYVKDICEEADIHRSSFYAHYEDINDLMNKTEEKLSSGISEIFKTILPYERQCFINLFRFIAEHKDFYRAYLTCNENSVMGQTDYLKYLKMVKSLDSFDDDIEFHLAFFSGGLQAVCKTWIMTGMKKTPEQMADVISNEYIEKAKLLNSYLS